MKRKVEAVVGKVVNAVVAKLPAHERPTPTYRVTTVRTPSQPHNSNVLIQATLTSSPSFTVPPSRQAEYPQVGHDSVQRFHYVLDEAERQAEADRLVVKRLEGDKRNQELGNRMQTFHARMDATQHSLTVDSVSARVKANRKLDNA